MINANFDIQSLSGTFARRLQMNGLAPVEAKQGHEDNATWIKVAKWRHLPIITLWAGEWFPETPKTTNLWFGFEGSQEAITTLRQKILGERITNSSLDILDDNSVWSIAIAQRNDGLIAETDYTRWFIGKYDVSFSTATGAEELCSEAADFIASLCFALEPSKEEQDINEIRKRRDITATERDALIRARRGQGRFRADLEEVWHGKCSVTSCHVGQVLRASHIKPWKLSCDHERLDSNNGLLLTANLDALFDRGLITFDRDGRLLCSNVLSSESKVLLGLSGLRLSQKPSIQQTGYLDFHRAFFMIEG